MKFKWVEYLGGHEVVTKRLLLWVKHYESGWAWGAALNFVPSRGVDEIQGRGRSQPHAKRQAERAARMLGKELKS